MNNQLRRNVIEHKRAVAQKMADLGVSAVCTHIQVNVEAGTISLAYALYDDAVVKKISNHVEDWALAGKARQAKVYRIGSHVIIELKYLSHTSKRDALSFDQLCDDASDPMSFGVGSVNGKSVTIKFGERAPHIGIIGPTRFGKSSLAACALLSLVRSTPAVKILVCDPDLMNEKTPAMIPGIRANLLRPPAITPEEIDRALVSLVAEIDVERDYPIVVVVDELPRVLKSAEARNAIQTIIQSGAKRDIHAMLISTVWGSDTVTGDWLVGVTPIAGYSRDPATAWRWLGVGGSGAEHLDRREFIIRDDEGFVTFHTPDMDWLGTMRNRQKGSLAALPGSPVAQAQTEKLPVAQVDTSKMTPVEKIKTLLDLGIPDSSIIRAVFNGRGRSSTEAYKSLKEQALSGGG